MRSIKVTFQDGNTLVTDINGTDNEIKDYYLNRQFNLGSRNPDIEDYLVMATKVEFLS